MFAAKVGDGGGGGQDGSQGSGGGDSSPDPDAPDDDGPDDGGEEDGGEEDGGEIVDRSMATKDCVSYDAERLSLEGNDAPWVLAAEPRSC